MNYVDDSEEDQSKRGKAITTAPHPFIVSYLRGSLFDWFIVQAWEVTLDRLRSEAFMCFRQLKKNKFEFIRYPTSLTGLLIYESQINESSSGGKQYNAPDGMRGTMGPPFVNKDPVVLVISPETGIGIKLIDKKYITPIIADHQVQKGETAKGIVKKITGKADLSVIVEAYFIGRKAIPGHILRVKNGIALIVTGSAENTEAVNVTISGALQFSATVNVVGYQKEPLNRSYKWRVDVPLNGESGQITIEAKDGQSKSISKPILKKANWVDIEYNVEGQGFFTEAVVVLRFDDGSVFRGSLSNGLSHFPIVPLLPFSVEFKPGTEKQAELDALYKELDTLLTEKVAEAKKESETLTNIYEQLPWFIQNKVNEFYTIKGAGHWVIDTVTGIVSLVYGAAKVLVQTEVWLAEYHLHHAKMGACAITGDQDCVKTEAQHIKSMLEALGEDVSEFSEIAQTFYYLATDGKTVKRLETFAKNYFNALSVPEQHQFVTRYGIDIALLFVAGGGAVLLGIKNASKVTALIKKISGILKTFPTKVKFNKPKDNVNRKNTFPPKSKEIDITALAAFEVQVGGKVLKAEAIREGTNGKIAVIGRSMGDRTGQVGVLEYANGLKKQPEYKNVEIETFSSPQVTKQMDDDFSKWIERVSDERGKGARLTDRELLKTKMYQGNKEWANKLKSEGYTVIDIGDPNNFHGKIPPEISVFYKMEKNILFR